jgi:hypothetical protein
MRAQGSCAADLKASLSAAGPYCILACRRYVGVSQVAKLPTGAHTGGFGRGFQGGVET